MVVEGSGQVAGNRLAGRDLSKRHLIALALLLACSLLAACSRGTSLTITNNSLATLTNVVASGSGFARSIAPLAPGATLRLKLKPGADSSLQLTFDTAGQHFSSPPDGYFETGYNVLVTVAPDFSVKVDAAPSS